MLRVIFTLVYFSYAFSLQESLNFNVKPSQQACFYQEVAKGSTGYQIDAFVESSDNKGVSVKGYGPLDEKSIMEESFTEPVFDDYVNALTESGTDSHSFIKKFVPTIPGVYAICIDNKSSRFMSRNIQLYITPLDKDESLLDGITDLTISNEIDKNKIQESLNSLHKIFKHLQTIQLQQTYDRRRLEIHRSMNQSSYNGAFLGSVIETFIFICVATFQIYFVRRWFSSRTTKGRK